MTAGVGSIDGIRARIGTIEARFVPERQDAFTVLGSAEFDPFGEAYQKAVETARRTSPATGVVAPEVTYAPRGFNTLMKYPNAPTGPAAGGRVAAATSNDPRVAAAINGQASTGGARPIGGYGSMPVPSSLQAYGNGKVPADRLVPISQNGHRLYAPASAAWEGVVAAAAADGFDLTITDSYRSFDQQVDLARRKGLYKNGGLAATPGTSIHGWGLAVDADLTDPAKLAWMRENGPRFGWVEAVPREPWHWEFRPHQV